MKIPYKVLLTSAILLTGLSLFMANIIKEQLNIARRAASIQHLCKLATATGSLVHELQTERGKSIGFLTGEGNVPASELKTQREKTDTVAGEIKDYLSRHTRDIPARELTNTVNAAWRSMADLEGVRTAIDTAKFSTQQTLEYYSQLNHSFLEIISRLTLLTAKSKFFSPLTAYLSVLYLKENAGVERAVLYSLVLNDAFEPRSFQMAKAAVAAQETFFDNFLSHASLEQKTYYAIKMQRPFVEEIEKVRRLILQNTQGPWEVDPARWFKTATEKIDVLEEIGDYIVQDLVMLSTGIKKKAQFTILNLIAMVTAGTMTLIVFLLASRSRLLRKGLTLWGFGLLFSMTIHAVVEYLETVGLMDTETLIMVMPVLVTTGSVIIIFAGVHTLYNVTAPLKTAIDRIKKFSAGDSSFDIGPELKELKNEVGDFARGFQNLVENLRKTTVSKSYFESILTTSCDAFVSIDASGSIIEWNPASERIFGWPRTQAIGKQLTETIIPEQYRERHTRGLKRFLATGESTVIGKTLELSALRRNGREFPIEITIWRTHIDKKHQLNAFIRDVSERKIQENELHNVHRNLAEREKALRRTFEKLSRAHERLKNTQNQLLQSEKLASIGQLAAGVAHEINNPAGFISNNMEILEQYIRDYLKILQMADGLEASIAAGDLKKAVTGIQDLKKLKEEIRLDYITEDVVKLLQQNREGIDRIRGIVTNLRTFARDDREDSTECIKIEDVVENVLRLVQSEIRYKAELQKNYADTPPVPCSPNRLGQVFLNLIVNALQAIEGRGTIEIRTYQQNGFVCVDVRDTGKGIDGQHLGKIFDPFFTTKAVGEGTGLGLSVSYEIVKKHGGDIKVKSKTGSGTTFTVMLPLKMAQTQQEI